MVFQDKTIKEYIKERNGIPVYKIYKIGDNQVLGEKEFIFDDNCTITYYADVDDIPGYSRFNLKQLLTEIDINYKDLIKYIRTRKLEKLN